jgi:RNase P/RNase MRP subunit p30
MEFKVVEAERQEQLRQFQGEGVLISSTNIEILRQACKNRRVAVLLNKFFQPDIGLLRDAKEHGKPFVFPIAMLLERNGSERGKLMARMSFFLKLCVQLGAPYLLISGAKNEYEQKSEEELVSIGECLGLSRDQALWSINETPKLLK